MPSIELHLFGRPRVLVDGKALDLPFERRHQLLAYLALKRGWVGRAEVAALLWPDVASRQAHANLRKTLFRLPLLSWSPQVESQPDALRFEADTDVARFEAALREGRADDALRFRAHDLLAGFDDGGGEDWSAWLGFERERLRSSWRAAALARIDAGGDAAEAVDITARLLEADPIDDDALRAHMSALARAGQVAAARRAYREFVQRLDKDFGLEPGAQLQAFHDALSDGAPGVAAAPAPPRATDEAFIGRASELLQIGDTLMPGECRLLCIVGPGGVGKTRLARRALQEFGGRYAHGTAFVALENVDTPAAIGPAIARELGVALADIEQTIKYLRDREMLVVLDNFEHLAHMSGELQRVLDACPRVQLIVTSRVRLGLRAEWTLPLDGLPCPDDEDADRLDAFDAARLFLRSAQRVDPRLAFAAEARAIIEICRAVEGLPLALELAASWTRALSCEEIAAELRSGTQLLRSQDPAWPERHGSIDAVFEHSWEMLGPAERDALSRLAVFRGGFSADAAQRVAHASLPVLAALVDKSLLRKESGRLYLHPLIQQLSIKRIDESVRGETESAHARYFHSFLEQMQRGADLGERAALGRIELEFDNCRAAWEWSIGHSDIAGLARGVVALRNYCDHRARQSDAHALLKEALEVAGDGEVAAILRTNYAQVLYRMDRYVDAIENAQRAFEALRGSQERVVKAGSLRVIGTSQMRLGRYAEARRAFRDSLKHVPMHDGRLYAILLDSLALIEKRMGNFEGSKEMSLRALEEFRAIGYAAAEAVCLNNLGSLHNEQDQFEAAKPFLVASLQVAERHGLVGTRILALVNLAESDLETGDLAQCRRHARAALEAAHAAGNRGIEGTARLHLARAALRERDIGAARAELQAASALFNSVGDPSLQLEAAILFGELLAAGNETRGAAAILYLAAAQPATSAVHRHRIDGVVSAWHIALQPAPAALSFAEVAERIAAEAPLAHAPLIAALRG